MTGESALAAALAVGLAAAAGALAGGPVLPAGRRPRRRRAGPPPSGPPPAGSSRIGSPPAGSSRIGSPPAGSSRIGPPPGGSALPGPPVHDPAGRSAAPSGRARRLAAAGAGLGLWAVLGGWGGVLAGVLLAVGLDQGLRCLEPAGRRQERERIAADLPMTAELVAAGVAAGLPLDRAVSVVAEAVGGPLGAALTEVATAVRWGADPVTAWAGLAETRSPWQPPAWAARLLPPPAPPAGPFGRAVGRALDAGAPLAPALRRLAAQERARARADRELAARRVGVRAVAPLTLCFLPAFVLVGVVPLVAAVAGEVLGPLLGG